MSPEPAPAGTATIVPAEVVLREAAGRLSKYQARGPSIDRTSYKATTGIEILAPAGP